MKASELTGIIEESVRKAIRDELKSLLVELLLKNQNTLVETKQPIFNVTNRQPQDSNKGEVNDFRQKLLSDFGAIGGDVKVGAGGVGSPTNQVNENTSVANLFKDVAGRMKQEDFLNFRLG